MPVELSEVWGDKVDSGASAKLSAVSTGTGATGTGAAGDPRDVMHRMLLEEIMLLRKEQAQRTSLSIVVSLVFLSIVIHYLDGLKKQIRRLEVARLR